MENVKNIPRTQGQFMEDLLPLGIIWISPNPNRKERRAKGHRLQLNKKRTNRKGKKKDKTLMKKFKEWKELVNNFIKG